MNNEKQWAILDILFCTLITVHHKLLNPHYIPLQS